MQMIWSYIFNCIIFDQRAIHIFLNLGPVCLCICVSKWLIVLEPVQQICLRMQQLSQGLLVKSRRCCLLWVHAATMFLVLASNVGNSLQIAPLMLLEDLFRLCGLLDQIVVFLWEWFVKTTSALTHLCNCMFLKFSFCWSVLRLYAVIMAVKMWSVNKHYRLCFKMCSSSVWPHVSVVSKSSLLDLKFFM